MAHMFRDVDDGENSNVLLSSDRSADRSTVGHRRSEVPAKPGKQRSAYRSVERSIALVVHRLHCEGRR
jgi:hypothetical protein